MMIGGPFPQRNERIKIFRWGYRLEGGLSSTPLGQGISYPYRNPNQNQINQQVETIVENHSASSVVNRLPLSSDNIKSILKISSSNSETESLGILAQILSQVGLCLFERHHSVILVTSGADKSVNPIDIVAINTKHYFSLSISDTKSAILCASSN